MTLVFSFEKLLKFYFTNMLKTLNRLIKTFTRNEFLSNKISINQLFNMIFIS